MEVRRSSAAAKAGKLRPGRSRSRVRMVARTMTRVWNNRSGTKQLPLIPRLAPPHAGSDAQPDPAWARGLNEQWQAVVISDGPGGILRSQSQPPIRVMQTFKPVNVTEPKPGVKVYDLGQNMSGWPRVSIKGDAGAQVTLKTGELLIPDGTVSQKHIGSPVSFSFTCRGGGE